MSLMIVGCRQCLNRSASHGTMLGRNMCTVGHRLRATGHIPRGWIDETRLTFRRGRFVPVAVAEAIATDRFHCEIVPRFWFLLNVLDVRLRLCAVRDFGVFRFDGWRI